MRLFLLALPFVLTSSYAVAQTSQPTPSSTSRPPVKLYMVTNTQLMLVGTFGSQSECSTTINNNTHSKNINGGMAVTLVCVTAP